MLNITNKMVAENETDVAEMISRLITREEDMKCSLNF